MACRLHICDGTGTIPEITDCGVRWAQCECTYLPDPAACRLGLCDGHGRMPIEGGAPDMWSPCECKVAPKRRWVRFVWALRRPFRARPRRT